MQPIRPDDNVFIKLQFGFIDLNYKSIVDIVPSRQMMHNEDDSSDGRIDTHNFTAHTARMTMALEEQKEQVLFDRKFQSG
jgi:hypothetical protein